MNKLIKLLFICSALIFAFCDPDSDVKATKEMFEGDWALSSAVKHPATGDQLKNRLNISFEGDKVIIKYSDELDGNIEREIEANYENGAIIGDHYGEQNNVKINLIKKGEISFTIDPFAEFAPIKNHIYTRKGQGTKEQTTKTNDPEGEPITIEESPALKPDYFICYNNDELPSLKMVIGFSEDGKAINVKYKGQKETMQLVFEKEDYQEGGAHPTISDTYKEMYEGKENGKYVLTHSGVWDYAKYTREKDGKVFNFTIDHDLTTDGGEYRKTSCY